MLQRIDHVRMFVGNARQSAYFYRNAFGFEVVAYAGLETGVRHEACYVLRQGQITFVLASPLSRRSPRRPAAGPARRRRAVDRPRSRRRDRGVRGRRGAGRKPARPPQTIEDEFGIYEFAEIQAYGDTTHTLRRPIAVQGVFAPGFKPLDSRSIQPADRFTRSGSRPSTTSSPTSRKARWATGSTTTARSWGSRCSASFDDKDISTDYSALMSKVVADGRGRIKFPINEPAKGRRRSQIDEFLEFYGGPGVQHIAMATGDIIGSVRAMVDNDVSFLKVPPAYYEMLPDRVGTIKEDIDELAELGILVDRDDEGYLLQIFTKPVEDRPTLFFEIIQRRGARSFGKGNFKALFEAIEREQARRGTL